MTDTNPTMPAIRDSETPAALDEIRAGITRIETQLRHLQSAVSTVAHGVEELRASVTKSHELHGAKIRSLEARVTMLEPPTPPQKSGHGSNGTA